MSKNPDSTLYSRDGDQFHYWWAARRCLRLLEPGTTLSTIAVEGVPPEERVHTTAGVEAIDVAEYHGSASLKRASSVIYYQLKHSTVRQTIGWTTSELTGTLSKFGARYAELVAEFGAEDIAARFRFEFVSNRLIPSSIANALETLRAGATTPQTKALEKAIGLKGQTLTGFALILFLKGDEKGFMEQRALLDVERVHYLVGADENAPLALREIVVKRATSEYLGRPEISRNHVLQALGASEQKLRPAECAIIRPKRLVKREAVGRIAKAVIAAKTPTIVAAEGGEGKSVLATEFRKAMPPGSVTVVYDCFGKGSYRSARGHRHRPSEGLVQIANELAMKGLCAPLVPSGSATPSDYLRAFMDRIGQASRQVARGSPSALLCLVIDAADNAQMIADDLREGPSFPRHLIRETWPKNVRLVLLARGYRVHLLDPPPALVPIEFGGFTLAETRSNLEKHGFSPSDTEVAEFSNRTSLNPRVQAGVLAEGGTLEEMLIRLGPKPVSVDDRIGEMLQRAVERAKDEALAASTANVDRLCEALATLRPFVPIDIVAQVADVSPSMVRSFVQDLGRPLLVSGDAVQFRDEPTETWFRENYKPDAIRIGAFIERLRPLTLNSTYAAATLPELLLDAGRFDELVELALNGGALPKERIARREIELHRILFALKAAIRLERFADASRLALKAGNESAIEARQQTFFASNTDLAARFIAGRTLAERVSRRELPGSGWVGSEHVYAAALLSRAKGLKGEAASHLRIGRGWLVTWLEAQGEGGKRRGKLETEDIAEIAMAELNLHGAVACAAFFRFWTRREVSYAGGKLLADRLVDAERYADLDRLSLAAGNDLGLIMAICVALDRVDRIPDRRAVARAITIAFKKRVTIRQCEGMKYDNARLPAVTALVIAGALTKAAPDETLARLLGRYIRIARHYFSTSALAGNHDDRDVEMRAYAVRSVLLGRHPNAASIVRLTRRRYPQSARDIGSLRTDFAMLLPWQTLAAQVRLRRVPRRKLTASLRDAETNHAGDRHLYADRRSSTDDTLALLWTAILLSAQAGRPEWERFRAWQQRENRQLFYPTRVQMARRAARTPGYSDEAIAFAADAARLAKVDHEHAGSTTDLFVSLSRATLAADEEEAKDYFNEAVTASENIGDENVWRFESLLYIAEQAASDGGDQAELAYGLSRAGELTRALVDRDKHFPFHHAIEVVTKLSPGSGPAVLSRWTDRRFGVGYDLLPEVIEALSDMKRLDPLDAICLLPMATFSQPAEALTRVAEAAAPIAERRLAFEVAVAYLRLSSTSYDTWEAIRKAAAKLGADTNEIERRRDLVRHPERKETVSPSRPGSKESSTAGVVDQCFDGINVTEPGALRTAALRLGQMHGVGFGLAEGVVTRMTTSNEARVIRALVDVPSFGALDLDQLIKTLTSDWAPRVASKAALADLVRAIAARDPHATATVRQWAPLDWGRLSALSGVSLKEAIAIAAAPLADAPSSPEATMLFTLASRWAQLLTALEASEVLRYGLQLYEPLLGETDGDGEWTDDLRPPLEPRTSLAGFLWAALADPLAKRRWEAAHVVRTACKLRRSALLADIVAFASTSSGGAFSACRFHFYDLNGLQWLTIALARAAGESPLAVKPHTSFLRTLAVASEPHVMIRRFAASALVELHRAGHFDATVEEMAALNSFSWPVAIPSMPSVSRWKHDHRPFNIEDRSGFLFSDELGTHGINPLSKALGVDRFDLECEMEKIIRSDWGLPFSGRWDEDARAGISGYGREWDRDERNPKEDSLSRYLQYHAMMVAAGRLLPAFQPDLTVRADYHTTYASWLRDHGLSRDDGRWLFDRRDPPPADVQAFPRHRGNWPGSETDADIKRTLRPISGWLTLRADFDRYNGQDREGTLVTCAFAPSKRARSLARALQVADEYDQRLPDHEASNEIAHGGYKLAGWVERLETYPDLDRTDPWTSGMQADALGIARHFRERLGLVQHDLLGREWTLGGKLSFRSEIWSEGIDGDDMRFSRGTRLFVRREVVDQILAVDGSSLIVQVRLERGRYRLRYESEGKTQDNVSKCTRIFVIEQGGRVWAPGPPARTWRRAY